MVSPSLALSSARPDADPGDVLVLFVRSGGDAPTVLGRDVATEMLAQMKATGAADQVIRMPAGVIDDLPVVLSGVGPAVTTASLRAAAGAAARSAAGDERLIVDPGVGADSDADGRLAAVLEGAAIGAYAYEGRSTRGAHRAPVSSIVVIGSADAADRIVSRAAVLADAVCLARDLGNTPPSAQGPQDLADSAVAAVADLPVDVKIWDEAALAADGFGGILGVGSGSARPPRLVRLDYAPAGAQKHLAFVGKGITFDSGGLSLKPPTSMVGMKYDMVGAASVLAAVVAVARLELSVHVTGWMCIAENLPSGAAIRPNDVLTIRGGTRVEVLNTDAEGRLVLADGLQAASEEHPDAVIDIATLTGAQIVALGTRYSAIMGDDDVVNRIADAAARSDELVWRMPLPAELRATLVSEVADLTNATPGNTAGGMLLAGVFLREFVGKASDDPSAGTVPWAHLDIAGSAQNFGSPHGYTPKGATGVLVRTLVAVAEDFTAR